MRQNKPYTKPGEAWTDIYPGYAISNQGRWYSYKRKQILKQFKNSSGYYRVYIHLDGSSKALFTHIKVVEVFGDKNGNKIPKDAESLVELKMSIDHIDANKKHNSQSNLELVTHQENCRRREIQKKTGGADKMPWHILCVMRNGEKLYICRQNRKAFESVVLMYKNKYPGAEQIIKKQEKLPKLKVNPSYEKNSEFTLIVDYNKKMVDLITRKDKKQLQSEAENYSYLWPKCKAYVEDCTVIL